MTKERYFPCCDDYDHVYVAKLDEDDARNYDENVQLDREGFPIPSSFERWVSDNPEIDDLWHACPDCGSDS
ncbi:hypothetical protein [Klebsiella sp. JB_Kp017]|uniref:hypothetical protein n=1 Tax=Klebsiella TaxID=570 RepID=UPI0032B53351